MLLGVAGATKSIPLMLFVPAVAVPAGLRETPEIVTVPEVAAFVNESFERFAPVVLNAVFVKDHILPDA